MVFNQIEKDGRSIYLLIKLEKSKNRGTSKNKGSSVFETQRHKECKGFLLLF